jgi:hypothetical protein
MAIQKEDKEKVKKLTGYNYTKVFLEFLKNNNISNNKGNPYSASHIRRYFSTSTNGSLQLDDSFLEFWDAISKEKKSNATRIQKLSDKTSELLNN